MKHSPKCNLGLCQIECDDSVLAPISFGAQLFLSVAIWFISSSVKNIFKKSNDFLPFEDTCGPVDFPPTMNFILGSVLLDSSQTVHFELLESLPKNDRSQWSNTGLFPHYEEIAQGLKKNYFFYMSDVAPFNTYIMKNN